MNRIAAAALPLAMAMLPAGFAIPAHAQGEAQPAASATADPDLRCAVWSAALLGNVKDGDAKLGLTAAFTYFMGRFEGRTGQSIEQAMTPEVVKGETGDMAGLTSFCLPQMEAMGKRLTAFGEQLKAAGV